MMDNFKKKNIHIYNIRQLKDILIFYQKDKYMPRTKSIPRKYNAQPTAKASLTKHRKEQFPRELRVNIKRLTAKESKSQRWQRNKKHNCPT